MKKLKVKITETLDFKCSSRKPDIYKHYEGPLENADKEYAPRLENYPRDHLTPFRFKWIRDDILSGEISHPTGEVKIGKTFSHPHNPEIRSHYISWELHTNDESENSE